MGVCVRASTVVIALGRTGRSLLVPPRQGLAERRIRVNADETSSRCDIDQDEALECNTFTALLCAIFEPCSQFPEWKVHHLAPKVGQTCALGGY